MPRRFVSVTVSRLRSQEPQGRVPVPRKPHCHRCHRHRCHRWREPLVHTRQPRFYGVIVIVGNGGGSVACCDFSHCSSSRMCGGVAWNWSVSLQGAGGRWRGECCVLGSENFFSGERKNFPWAGSKIFPFERGKFPIRAGGASCLKTGGPLGQQLWRRLGQRGAACSYL